MATSSAPPLPPSLAAVSPASITFTAPKKRIHSGGDLSYFPATPAYNLLTSFLTHLSASVTPLSPHTGQLQPPSSFYTNNSELAVSEPIQKLLRLINDISAFTAEAPPVSGPRRFGNTAFRTWHTLAENYITEKLKDHVPESCHPALQELQHYLVASLGSKQRLDYGTGHELDFTAFLAGLWKLGALKPGDEAAIVLKLYDTYFELVRKLVVEYNLEPAGSHGVWGLDDHSFLPYIFGSAQLTTYLPTLTPPDAVGEYAVLNELPQPKDVTNKDTCSQWADKNLYFSAIDFIHRVKSGPFWEHSPMLYDISGVQKGWAKVNEGMRKMYENEVLGKFPVVQHFWFGGIFEWNGPIRDVDGDGDVEMEPPTDSATTRAPWMLSSASPSGASPRTAITPPTGMPATGIPSTQAPWANPAAAAGAAMMPPTRAPWASSPSPSSSVPTATATPPRAPIPSPSIASPPLRDPLTDLPISSPSPIATPNLEPLKTTAPLGPVRTSSPDSATASALASAPQSPRHERRPSGVAAESGDLNELRRQHSQSRSRSRSTSIAGRSREQSQSRVPPGSGTLRDPFVPALASASLGAVNAGTVTTDQPELKTTAPLGPVRTRSPDSAVALRGGEDKCVNEDVDEEELRARERRRSAFGSGEVAVAEMGDLRELKERRESRGE